MAIYACFDICCVNNTFCCFNSDVEDSFYLLDYCLIIVYYLLGQHSGGALCVQHNPFVEHCLASCGQVRRSDAFLTYMCSVISILNSVSLMFYKLLQSYYRR